MQTTDRPGTKEEGVENPNVNALHPVGQNLVGAKERMIRGSIAHTVVKINNGIEHSASVEIQKPPVRESESDGSVSMNNVSNLGNTSSLILMTSSLATLSSTVFQMSFQ